MRKLWNRPNQAVWSLATTDQNGLGNMNICTYVSAVSMEPKLMMVAIYHNTKTHMNVVTTKRALLQLLSEDLAAVSKVCGHLSGKSIDKILRLKKRYPLGDRNGIPYFINCAGFFALLLWMAARLDRGRTEASRLGVRSDGHSPQEMAMGVFSLAEMGVSEVMTPRLDIIAVQVGESEAEVVTTLRRSEHARLLVFDGHPDAVVGVIYAKDVLPRVFALEPPRDTWQSLIRPAAFVPTGKTLNRQLRDFQRGPGHLAVVVDEFGGTAGIVTLEDILEQIVGEIQDEHDVDEVEPVQRFEDGRLVIEGGVPLADLEAELGHDFEREDVATVGGLVLAALGRVPRTGESLEIDGWKVDVELVVRRRIRRVAFWQPLPVRSADE